MKYINPVTHILNSKISNNEKAAALNMLDDRFWTTKRICEALNIRYNTCWKYCNYFRTEWSKKKRDENFGKPIEFNGVRIKKRA